MFQKQSPRPLLRCQTALTGILSAALLLFVAGAANAQAMFAFSGGSGSPLTLTLAAPVTYTVDVPVPNFPVFLFDAASPDLNYSYNLTGTLTYTINGSGPYTIDLVGSKSGSGAATPDDLYLFSSASPLVTAGDVVVLQAGTATTLESVNDAAPISGSFTTFLTDGAGNRISPDAGSAVAAPEPGSIALVLTAGIPLVGVVRRRKNK